MSDFHQTMITAGIWMIVAALYSPPDRDALLGKFVAACASVAAAVLLLNEVLS